MKKILLAFSNAILLPGLIATYTISANSDNSNTNKDYEQIKTQIINQILSLDSNIKRVGNSLIFNKEVILYNQSQKVDYNYTFIKLLNTLYNNLISSNQVNELLNTENLYISLGFDNELNRKTFELKIHNNKTKKVIAIIHGEVFFTQKLYKYQNSQMQELMNKINGANFQASTLNDNEKSELKDEMSVRLIKNFFQTRKMTNNRVIENHLIRSFFDEDGVETFIYNEPFAFDFYSEHENEKVKINGIELQVVNRHFKFDIRTLLSSQNGANEWEFKEPIELEITKYNPQNGSEIFNLKQRWIVNSSIANSTYRVLSWNPSQQYDQFNLITPYLTNLNREFIIDAAGEKVPNPQYDPYLNPQTGTKTKLVWLNLPKRYNFYQNYRDNEEFKIKFANQWNANTDLINYYKNNNIPLGVKVQELNKTLYSNYKNIKLPQGILADSIVSNAGIEFQIPDDVDFVAIYRLKDNKEHLDFEAFDQNDFVKVLRNTKYNINQSFKNFYFSQKGNYLVISSKENGESNTLLLAINSDNTNKNFIDTFEQSYVLDFFKTDAGQLFKDFLVQEIKLSNEKIMNISYQSALAYWKIFVGQSFDVNKQDNIFKYFGIYQENDIYDIPQINNMQIEIAHDEFMNNNVTKKRDYETQKLQNMIAKLQEQYQNNQSNLQLFSQIQELKSQLLTLEHDPLNYEIYKNDFYDLFYNNLAFKNRIKPLYIKETTVSNQGENPKYITYEYRVSFGLIPEFLKSRLSSHISTFSIKFLNPNFNQSVPATDVENDHNNMNTGSNDNSSVITINNAYIDKLTHSTSFDDFDSTIFENMFSIRWLNDLDVEAFKQYDFKVKFAKDFETKEIFLNIFYKLKSQNEYRNLVKKLVLRIENPKNLFTKMKTSVVDVSAWRNSLTLEITQAIKDQIAKLFNDKSIKYGKDYIIENFDDLAQKIDQAKVNNQNFVISLTTKIPEVQNNWISNSWDLLVKINGILPNKIDLATFETMELNFAKSDWNSFNVALQKQIKQKFNENARVLNLDLSDFSFEDILWVGERCKLMT
ncbi:hypothetical protein C4M96_03365 [Mycoplasmopsis pullorum]|uniref:Mbov_0399 family ICE element protein n=2 Tax=Mycoplasmopsis pullorum TaxID=48003 RepID=UPI00111A6305|nr:hypothetical protein [Mycoplasmopsis pullorum]TNK91814.1 hypothetical protein C4M96_03365 [Mycoplasmopsis pullorum]